MHPKSTFVLGWMVPSRNGLKQNICKALSRLKSGRRLAKLFQNCLIPKMRWPGSAPCSQNGGEHLSERLFSLEQAYRRRSCPRSEDRAACGRSLLRPCPKRAKLPAQPQLDLSPLRHTHSWRHLRRPVRSTLSPAKIMMTCFASFQSQN